MRKTNRYRYTGPISAITPTRDGQPVTLFPGKEVDMAPGHPYTHRLLAKGHLTEIPRPATKARGSSKSADKEV